MKKFFVHKSEFEEQFPDSVQLAVGTLVSFVPGFDERSGKERACRIRMEGPQRPQKGAGYNQVNQAGYNQAWEPGRLYGQMTSWTIRSACGFLETTEEPIPKRFFAHKTDFEEQFHDGMQPPPGTLISFVPGFDQKSGKERACFIRIEGPQRPPEQGFYRGPPMRPPEKGFYHHGPPMHYGAPASYGPPIHYGAAPMYRGPPMMHRGPSVPYGAHRLLGTLMEWDTRKACGFIDAQGQKFFAHKSEFVRQFADGDEPPLNTLLSFVSGNDPKSGKVRAQAIQIENPSYIHGRPRLAGELSVWDAGKACGFILCQQYPGKKLFAHKSDFEVSFEDGQDPPVGTSVTFVLGTDPKSGRDRAQSIRQESEMGANVNGLARFNGELSEWDPARACGFILCSANQPGCPSKRLFAHKSEFDVPFPDGQDPLVGSPVSFTFGFDLRSGRERAQNISFQLVDRVVEDNVGDDGARHRLRGTLQEWSAKAWGFIACEGPPPKKLFAHKSDFVTPFEDGDAPLVGSVVSFVLGIDSKSGRERAQEIIVEEAPAEDDAGQSDAKRARMY
jgi:hypothetical protein